MQQTKSTVKTRTRTPETPSTAEDRRGSWTESFFRTEDDRDFRSRARPRTMSAHRFSSSSSWLAASALVPVVAVMPVAVVLQGHCLQSGEVAGGW